MSSSDRKALIDEGVSYKRPFIHPDNPILRYFILVFICLLTFGSYFVYDNPGALTLDLEDWYHIDKFEYEGLYSVYSWPNTVQVFFGGILIDRVFGIRTGALIFCTLVMIGQIVFAASSIFKLYWMALLGRFIFGLGGESLSVTQNTYVAKWFRGKELAMAFGITLSSSRIGSFVNFNTEPAIVSRTSITVGLTIGAILCVVSLGNALFVAMIDRKAEENSRVKKDVKAADDFSIWDVFYFPISTWFIYVICMTFYVSVFIFVTIASSFLGTRFGFNSTKAGHAVSIIYLISACISPFLGFGVDFIGRSLIWVGLACFGLSGCHVLLWLGSAAWVPWVALSLMGICYSICAAALWPSIALIIPTSKLGTAYGLMTALQNLALAVAPLVVGKIAGGNDYTPASLMFIGCAATAGVLSVVLIFVDAAQGFKLNASGATNKARAKAQEEAEKQKAAIYSIQSDADNRQA